MGLRRVCGRNLRIGLGRARGVDIEGGLGW